jgi:hypothetical protein
MRASGGAGAGPGDVDSDEGEGAEGQAANDNEGEEDVKSSKCRLTFVRGGLARTLPSPSELAGCSTSADPDTCRHP